MVTYEQLINALSSFLTYFVDYFGTGVSPVTVTILNQSITFEKGFAFIVAVLPQAFAILALIVAIHVARKVFLKFSR